MLLFTVNKNKLNSDIKNSDSYENFPQKAFGKDLWEKIRSRDQRFM